MLDPLFTFGEYNEEGVIQIPYDAIMNANADKTQALEVGHPIKIVDENQFEHVGEVTAINVEGNTVTVDFNHPFAGKTIHFSGKILDIREASDSEMDHGHAHHPGHEHH